MCGPNECNFITKNVSIGDKIQIDILKMKFNKQRTVSVYGLRNSKGEYSNISECNLAKKKNGNSIAVYLLLGFSFWMLGYGIYSMIEMK